MKLFKILGTLPIVFAVSLISAQSGGVEISFSYNKQFGFASNQFAVWVEDSKGVFVKTLYAASFTADGGWKRRPLSLPEWVKKSSENHDAVTGATPKGGVLKYTWDAAGAKGEYFICLEATLRSEKRVLYRAKVRPGKAELIHPDPQYFGDDSKERGMITDVVISVK